MEGLHVGVFVYFPLFGSQLCSSDSWVIFSDNNLLLFWLFYFLLFWFLLLLLHFFVLLSLFLVAGEVIAASYFFKVVHLVFI